METIDGGATLNKIEATCSVKLGTFPPVGDYIRKKGNAAEEAEGRPKP